MSDKLYISVLTFKYNTLSEAGQELQKYLDLGINPILSKTDILVSVLDYSKILSQPTDIIEVKDIYDLDGNWIRNWYIEMERRSDGVIQGKLVGKGIGCLKFIKKHDDSKFVLGGRIRSQDGRGEGMLLRMSKRLEITA